ncbi:ABC transporter substrate-binding protein [Saccharomonospora sp. NPDC046836]|uniref:ABC transporter substrate-binding protein n=1 Tax=Saccharomonospora sp. NPDC046836 TaxID=3156921 RepID=UPI0033D47D63
MTITHRLRRTLVGAVSALLLLSACATGPGGQSGSDGSGPVRINQAFQSLLYLPLYVAEDQGFFADEGVDVEISTGGGGTQSWSAVLGGSADFSIQDPVFVPKTRESGGEGVVVAGVQDAPTVFILGKDGTSVQDDLSTLEGKRVIVGPEPDTTWAFMTHLIEQNGLQNVELVNVAIGNELAAVASGQADYALAVEPQISEGEQQGLHIVYSFSANEDWYPFAFSSLTSTPRYLNANPETAQSVVTAFERAYRSIYADPEAAVTTAEKYFPEIDPATVRAAVERNIAAKGYPSTALVTNQAWDHNLEIAAAIGNVEQYPSEATSYENNVNTELATRAKESVGA